MKRKFLHVTVQERKQNEKDDTVKDQTEACGCTILLCGDPGRVGESVGSR
jgi:hypothetical protein